MSSGEIAVVRTRSAIKFAREYSGVEMKGVKTEDVTIALKHRLSSASIIQNAASQLLE